LTGILLGSRLTRREDGCRLDLPRARSARRGAVPARPVTGSGARRRRRGPEGL